MLQLDAPEDFILATGETHEVRKFVVAAFRELGIELKWEGAAENEKGIDKQTGKILVEVDPKYYRPTEVDLLIGDASKAKQKLGWEATTKFADLARLMAKADFELVKRRGY